MDPIKARTMLTETFFCLEGLQVLHDGSEHLKHHELNWRRLNTKSVRPNRAEQLNLQIPPEDMDLTPEIIAANIAKARAKLVLRKQRRWTSSKLDAYSEEIFAYRKGGASMLEISLILYDEHRLSVHSSTISRWLKAHGA